MQMNEQVLTALEVLRNFAENDFEKHRIDVLEKDLTAPSKVEIIDDKHQKFNGVIYRKSTNGYFNINHSIHREVWTYFKGNIPDSYDVHHKDGNKCNNDISNLQIANRAIHRKLHSNPLVEKICPVCGKNFTVPFHQRNLICCSKECGYVLTWKTRKNKQSTIKKICPVCGNEYIPRRATQICCSKKCSGKNRKTLKPRNCPVCGKTFTSITNRIIYCSHSCARKSRDLNKSTSKTAKTD